MAKKKTPAEYLAELTNLGGVNAATIIGRDGFVIENSSKTEIDLDALGAVVSTGFGSSEVMGTEIGMGALTQTIMEYDSGKILMAACGEDAMLTVVTDGQAILGNIRHNMKKIIAELAKII